MAIYTAIITYKVNNKSGTNQRSQVINLQVSANDTETAFRRAMNSLSLSDPIAISGEVNLYEFTSVIVNPPK